MIHVVACFYCALWSRLAGRSAKAYENDHFLVILVVWVFSQRFWVGKWVFYIRMAWSGKSATCIFLPKCFSFLLWWRSACRIADTYKKFSFFSVFGRFGLCSQDLGQVQGQIILYLIKIKRVCFTILCQILLVFLGTKATGKSVQTSKKWSILSIFCRLGPFP